LTDHVWSLAELLTAALETPPAPVAPPAPRCVFRRSRSAGPTEGEHPVRAKPNTSSERRRTARLEPR